jgi:hypothetical protein
VAGLAAALGALAAQRTSPEDKSKEKAQALVELPRRGFALVERAGPGARGAPVWSRRILDAELDLRGNTEERMAALQKYVERAIKLERVARESFAREAIGEVELLEAEYHRCEAEALLERAHDGKVYPRE